MSLLRSWFREITSIVHLEQTLNLSFVREFVQETYAHGGRPSTDLIVFFLRQVVYFYRFYLK